MRAMMVVSAVLLPALLVSGQIPGGINDISLELDHPVLLFATEQIREEMNFGDRIHVIVVEESKSQVTDRVTYFLKLRMSNGYVCTIQVVDYWVSGMSVKGQPSCTAPGEGLPRESRDVIVGGESERQPLPPQGGPRTATVLDALDAAVCEVSARASNAFKIERTSGIVYTTQVTAGTTYRYYRVPLVQTTCNNKVCNRNALDRCNTNGVPERKRCDFKVQYAAWMDPQFDVTKERLSACLDLS